MMKKNIPLEVQEASAKGRDAGRFCTIVITMDPKDGNFSLAGNVLKDVKLCLMMLVEAGHKLVNETVQDQGKPN